MKALMEATDGILSYMKDMINKVVHGALMMKAMNGKKLMTSLKVATTT